MLASSREAFARGHATFVEVLGNGADRMRMGRDLFLVTSTLDSSTALRQALVDTAREPLAKTRLVTRLFDGKVGEDALVVLTALAHSRWAGDRDLSDSAENLAVEAVVWAAEQAGRLDDVEDELFRFGRVVDGTPALREALSDRSRSGEDKAALVEELLSRKVGPEALLLLRQSVLAPRGRRFDRVLEVYEQIAARRRQQVTATVTSAVPLDERQRDRLGQALARIYGHDVQLNLAVDPEVVGGIRVQIGDEVLDGSILRRLDVARRRLAG